MKKALLFSSFFSFLLLFLSPLSLKAASTSPQREESPQSISESEIEAISSSDLQENSPFYLERQEAREALKKAATNPLNAIPTSPKHHSVQEALAHLGKNLEKIFPKKGSEEGISSEGLNFQVQVEPFPFSVETTSELKVTLEVINNQKQLVMFEFPTSQRMEVVVKNQEGTPIYDWANDRIFEQIVGNITVNPKESLYFEEKIPTKIMHNGETYTIEVSLAYQKHPAVSQEVTPQANASPELNTSEEATSTPTPPVQD